MGGASVAEALEELQQRVQLLDGNQLEGLDARLTALLQKFTQVQEKKKEKEAGEGEVDEQRVNELLELMNKWDNSCTALPALVDRMHSLQKLHEQGAVIFNLWNMGRIFVEYYYDGFWMKRRLRKERQ